MRILALALLAAGASVPAVASAAAVSYVRAGFTTVRDVGCFRA